jgi:hypothetical protein
MALVEVYISNGLPNNSVVIKDGESHTLELTTEELLDLNNSIAELQVQDVSNNSWLINNDIPAGVYLKQPYIDNNITCCDKASHVGKSSKAYDSLNDLVNSIIKRI